MPSYTPNSSLVPPVPQGWSSSKNAWCVLRNVLLALQAHAFTCFSRCLTLLIKPSYLTARDCLESLAKTSATCSRCGSPSRVRDTPQQFKTTADQLLSLQPRKQPRAFSSTAPTKRKGLFHASLGSCIYMRLHLQPPELSPVSLITERTSRTTFLQS